MTTWHLHFTLGICAKLTKPRCESGQSLLNGARRTDRVLRNGNWKIQLIIDVYTCKPYSLRTIRRFESSLPFGLNYSNCFLDFVYVFSVILQYLRAPNRNGLGWQGKAVFMLALVLFLFQNVALCRQCSLDALPPLTPVPGHSVCAKQRDRDSGNTSRQCGKRLSRESNAFSLNYAAS